MHVNLTALTYLKFVFIWSLEKGLVQVLKLKLQVKLKKFISIMLKKELKIFIFKF